MSGRTRRMMMAGIVALVLLWPLVHLGLVAQARTDAWEFFGWAMYSKPAARVQVRVEVERGGKLEPLLALGETRRRVGEFANARTVLGSFASPVELLTSIFENDATIEAVLIELRDVQLDLDSAYLIANDEQLRFERPR